MTQISALFFDLDDTLANNTPSHHISLERVLPSILKKSDSLNPKDIVNEFNQQEQIHWEDYDNSPLKQIKTPEASYAFLWNITLNKFGIDDPSFCDEIAKEFYGYRIETYECYPDVFPVLDKLKKQYPIFLVTNGNSQMQRAKIEACKIEPYVEKIFIAQEVGYSKPNVQIFDRALDALDLPREEVLMVGDNPAKDIAGGIAAGLQTAWIRRHDFMVETCTPEPTFSIETLEEIVTILKQRSTQDFAHTGTD